MTIDFTAVNTLIQALNESDHTQIELQNLTGLGTHAIGRWMREFVKRKFIYVCEWRRSGKIWVAVYSWGFEQDSVPRPARLTQSEYNRRAKAKKKSMALHSSSVNIFREGNRNGSSS